LCRNYTSSSPSSHQFDEFYIKTPRFNLILSRLTANTFVLAVLPPGEAELNCTRINIAAARADFEAVEPFTLKSKGDAALNGSSKASSAVSSVGTQ